jgi:outer membrane murein-binding lipoprotein Lpp
VDVSAFQPKMLTFLQKYNTLSVSFGNGSYYSSYPMEEKMKKTVCVIFAVVFICVFFSGCSKKVDAASSQKEETGIKVDAVKITDDIDSAFKVQAQIQSDPFRSGGGDLGIVGTIEDGKLTLSIANPEEDFLHDPFDLDLGCDTEGMRIGELKIATSGASVILDNSQSGWSLTIWFATMDGNVNFYGVDVPFKKGWNFFEGALGVSMENPQIWTSLQDVYEKGYYKWTLAAQ